MDRYHEMAMFDALSERPSLASAARRLNVSGATMARAIARLEARLGVVLLQRSTQGVVLTPAGSAFMADCSRILKAVGEAEASAKGLHVKPQGSLTVLMPSLFSRHVMPPMLAEYLDAYPQITLFAHYHDRFPHINEEGLDVAVWIGALPDSSLIARPVGFVTSVVCASPTYLSASGVPAELDDLKRHRLIATHAFKGCVHWDFQAQGSPTCIKARCQLSCATVQAAIDAAAHGAGLIRCLNYPLHDDFENGRLQRVLQRYEGPALPVHVIYRERRSASMRVRSFVDFIVDALRGHPALHGATE
jgi:DNA-binding transcriptional LysR family regulator